MRRAGSVSFFFFLLVANDEIDFPPHASNIDQLDLTNLLCHVADTVLKNDTDKSKDECIIHSVKNGIYLLSRSTLIVTKNFVLALYFMPVIKKLAASKHGRNLKTTIAHPYNETQRSGTDSAFWHVFATIMTLNYINIRTLTLPRSLRTYTTGVEERLEHLKSFKSAVYTAFVELRIVKYINTMGSSKGTQYKNNGSNVYCHGFRVMMKKRVFLIPLFFD
ncbi:hypothetical protein K501DRAFT_277900 [Backusella circina FSU 941]|nr:hypothetical protein K501DRAFT_277900 [Backusella circina FSU 941]